MNNLSTFLEVDDTILAFRSRRAQLVASGLESLGVNHPSIPGKRLVDFAMVNELAAHIRDEAHTPGVDAARLLASVKTKFEHGFEVLRTVGPLSSLRVVGLDEDQCMFEDGLNLESLTPEEATLLRDAVDVLDSTQVLAQVAQSVGVVAVLGLVQPGEPVATWATGRLPYVVHLHLMPRPQLIARDLIHEATHTFLNDWLGSRGIALDHSRPRFWSPWKDTERPLFGFVHSIVAFSVVTKFLDGVMNSRDEDWSWLRPFYLAERGRLLSCESSVAAAADELPHELAIRVRDVYSWAVSCA